MEIKFRGKVLGGWEYVSPESSRWAWFWSLVDSGTVGQYVGLKDNKGIDIYEGDIVKDLEYIDQILGEYVVEYDEMMLLVPFHQIIGYDGELWMQDTVYEIIGNIHDNPNLGLTAIG